MTTTKTRITETDLLRLIENFCNEAFNEMIHEARDEIAFILDILGIITNNATDTELRERVRSKFCQLCHSRSVFLSWHSSSVFAEHKRLAELLLNDVDAFLLVERLGERTRLSSAELIHFQTLTAEDYAQYVMVSKATNLRGIALRQQFHEAYTQQPTKTQTRRI